MNRFFLSVLPAIVLTMALSCTKETGQKQTPERGRIVVSEFKASVDDAVKTTLGENGAVSWKAGDEIAVFNEEGAVFKFSATSAGASTTFTQVTEGELSGSVFYAVYPYSESLVWNSADKKVTVSTPDARYVNPGDFGTASGAIMTACSTTDELHFKNLASLMKFTVPEDLEIKTVYLYASGHDISGSFEVAIASDGTPSVSANPTTYNGITLSTADETRTTLAPGNYWVPIIPGSYSNLRCKLTYSDDKISEAFSLNSFTAERNGVTFIGTFYDGISWYKWLTFEDGSIPTWISDKSDEISIVANPVIGKANGSAKVLQSYKASGSTSSYITLNLSSIPQGIRKNIKGIKFQIILPSASSKWYPRVKFATTGSLSSTAYLPASINGKKPSGTDFTQAEFNSATSLDFWNILEYRAEQFGLDNFKDITKIQFRPTIYFGSAGNLTAPVTVYIDNIGFTYE